ncbi:MAG: membrane protein insertase YidC [Gemmatimonadetes bacterium]|nr:membrane protein insertase YidC [Gemmatimonadota bacterium]
MEKRLIVAVLLMSAVIMLTNLLFPPPLPEETSVEPDSVVAVQPPQVRAAPVLLPTSSPAAAVRADTVNVVSDLYRLSFTTRGAGLRRAEMLDYQSYTEDGPVQLVPEGAREFLSKRLVVGADTIDLAALPFAPSERELRVDESTGPQTLSFQHGSDDGFGVMVEYTFRPDEYLIDVRGRVTGLGGQSASLLTEIGPGLAPHEAFEHRSEQQLAVVTRAPGDVTRLRTNKLEGQQLLAQPFTWVGIKDKYFLAALIAGEETPMEGAVVRRLPNTQHVYPEDDRTVTLAQADLVAIIPVSATGDFSFQAYMGPQDYTNLKGVGFDLENVTQYAYRWLEPVIRPVAALILWVLRWLHNTLGVEYGWVLVLFGVIMRIVLWPLNAKAMRAQMKNMGVQPLMTEIREKYKDDPQAQQKEMMRLYKEHGFNPLAGCLPLLVPFPVLITLFFVFQNTIAFRGAEFLWLPDLSLRDPIFVLPAFLVISMFALQWISMKMSGMDQNPQMKMMMYVMPVMMGVLFFSLPAGLNLYYATTNVASIPQQMLIARERKRAQAEAKFAATAPKPPLAPAAAAARKRKRKK